MAANAGLVLAGLVSFILMGAGQSVYGPAIPAFAREFGISTGQAGVLISAHWVGSGFGVALMFFRGHLGSPRLSLAGMAAGALVIGLGIGWLPTLAGAMVLGFGYGIATVIYNRRFLARFGERGPSMVALLNAIFAIGAIGAPLVFVAIGSDPHMAYLGIAALAALTCVLAAAPAEPVAAGPQAPGRFSLRPGILAFGAVAIGMEACLIGLGPLALIALGQTEAGAAQGLSMFFAAFLLVRLALVGVAGMVPPFPMYLFAVTLTAVAAASAAITGWTWLFVVLGGCAGLYFPAFYVAAVRQMGDDPRVTPTIIAAGLVGGIASPVIVGGIMALAGDAVFFPVLAVVAATAALAAATATRSMARAAA